MSESPQSAPAPTPRTLSAGSGVWEVFDAWLRRASEVIGASTEALNALNVFPISDADTGSNLQLTLAGIARAVPDVNRASMDAVVQAAILSAHGSSGAIVAEMFSSVCRSLQHPTAGLAGAGTGHRIALLLRTVADAAHRAVAQPVAGTILTVAADAARAAEGAARTSPENGLAVARAAQAEARLALQRTPDQLDVLAEAGVVDAGGQAYALLVDALVEVLGGEPALPLTAGETARPARSTGDPEYEVMYALHDAAPEALVALREKLSDLGHSVVVVGESGAGVAQVHVHLGEPGAAVEAALGLGRLSQVRITVLEPTEAPTRTVVAVVAGAGLARAALAAGAVPVLVDGDEPVLNALVQALGRAEGDVVILPNDMETLEAAHHLVARRRAAPRPSRPARRMAVIPTVAQVQGLAALAVHEPEADFDTAVAAMSAAAGHARHGAVTVAESDTRTMAGRSVPGEVLGVVEGDFVEIGDRLVEVAWRVVERLLAGGGELLTLVLGADAPLALADELTHRSREQAAGLEIQVIDGGQARYLLLVGVE
ncbi:DAK2 domain-containing protein [uncultured Friedmanniella sp.]|uniref:DAK2 domain-containing protein n=1 Tax=uncultured Friedmanniella sp. TaxID=335381 RepID=UPI0035CC8477